MCPEKHVFEGGEAFGIYGPNLNKILGRTMLKLEDNIKKT
jgi:hypothetical protein